MMRYAKATIPALLLLASGCAGQDTLKISYPPLADLKAVVETKPIPTPEIVTDPEADALYSAQLELWGERLQAAGLRICQWYVDVKVLNADLCVPWSNSPEDLDGVPDSENPDEAD